MTLSHGFELQREERIEEIGSIARLYRHGKTGAELLSVIGEDENKVFGASFRTPPQDSTGIAHILEHSVLCGSRKYPVKAPFLELLKGSLNTFLNAMTYPDKTVYPVASTNLQDFYNLVDVYLDAVFHPRITPEILQQEGWHYELETPDAPLTCKGVVFNEMKGVYSSPDSRASTLSGRSLYPDTIYGIDSGGDPREIPDLTYENFKAFHERYYNPSNARLFFYGDDDPDKRLEILDRVLSEFAPARHDSQIPLQPRFNAPRKLEYAIPASAGDEGKKRARLTVNWMLDEIADPEAQLALTILNYSLTGTPASPLRKALIDSRLGEDVTAMGLNTALRQMKFGAGLKGIDAADAEKVEALILDTLERLSRDGIDPATVEAAINTIEFRLRENNTGSFPRGISVMLRALQSWNYGRDPIEPLLWSAPLDGIKARLARGERVFEPLIKAHLLDNPHRTTVLFKPDPEQAEREAREERERLDAARAAMSEADLQRVIEQTKLLKRIQETPDSPEALGTIPRLGLKDLPARNAPIPIETGALSGALLVTHDLQTNGIVYLDIGFDLRRLPAGLLPYAGIFRYALLETGAGALDFVRLSQRIGSSTGGISTATLTATKRQDGTAGAWLFLRAKAVSGKLDEMTSILIDVLTSARLGNRERVEQLIDEERAGMEARLVPSGSSIADYRLRASLTEADWAQEQMSGVSYLNFLRGLAARMKEDPSGVTEALERIRDILVRRGGLILNVTAEAGDLRKAETHLQRLVAALPEGASNTPEWTPAGLPRFEGLTMPSKVNYVAKGENLRTLGFAPGGAAWVASQWLRSAWLWEKVRVQGGAYGAFSSLDLRSGVMTFMSYRDPNLTQTLAAYDGAGAFLRGVADNRSELERAIIGVIGQIDAYRLPDAKGYVSLQRHLLGDTEDIRQKIRDEVLGAGAAELRVAADAVDALAAHGRSVVLGSAEAIGKANESLDGRFTMTKVL
jgi:Zn-dependent M16 (insulinase) family peptidase